MSKIISKMSKVFIITGTRKGIGFALAKHYLGLGFIVAGCSRGIATIEHSNYLHYELDIVDEVMVKNMVRSVKKKYGKIDVLINNAGIAAMNHILTSPLNSGKKIFSTNFFGSFLFIREVSKVMMRKNNGRIVNFSTIAAPLNLEGEAIYAASKSAIESFTKIASKELSEFGIRINAIGPTPIATDLIRNIPKNKIDNLLAAQAIPRLGIIDDVVNVIDFFINENSDFITGQVIYLGGVTR